MDNFDLKKYLAEGKLREEKEIVYAVIEHEVDFAVEDEDGNMERHDDMFILTIGEIDEDGEIEDEWDHDLVSKSKEYSAKINDMIDKADDYEWESHGGKILSTHKDMESAEKAKESLNGVEYF